VVLSTDRAFYNEKDKLSCLLPKKYPITYCKSTVRPPLSRLRQSLLGRTGCCSPLTPRFSAGFSSLDILRLPQTMTRIEIPAVVKSRPWNKRFLDWLYLLGTQTPVSPPRRGAWL